MLSPCGRYLLMHVKTCEAGNIPSASKNGSSPHMLALYARRDLFSFDSVHGIGVDGRWISSKLQDLRVKDFFMFKIK
jgi:hypothetical protein